MRIVIFGANGPTGRLLTDQALESGHDIVAFTRRPGEFPVVHDRLTTMGGDVYDPAAVERAVSGADAVLSTLGVPFTRKPITTYSAGVANIVAAMNRHGVRRIAVVSSSAVDPHPYADAGFLFNRVLQPFITGVLGRTLYADMRAMEALLTASDLEWTIVRPSGLFDLPHRTDYTMAEGRAEGRFTARSDLAACLLRLAETDHHVRTVVGVVTTTDNPGMLDLLRAEAFGKS
ncbi:NAD(P)-dependent oxidoreductase [Nocardia testacea]|uniref:NAD(P)-dependent oxidoreductase n=1 Tax=Nocardia testacea TaxID=248551 RepID=UPI0002FBADF5|nr:NAD(P)H-binding protein [Nocardia testacea]